MKKVDKSKRVLLNEEISDKSLKNSKYIFLSIFGIIFLLTLKMAISYFIKYYNSFNVPIIIDDNGINKLINKSYSINLSLLFNILIFIIPIFIILYLKLKNIKKQIYIIFIIIPLILFYTLLFTFKINDKLDNNDWNMSIETVERKQRGGRKGRQCYVYLKGYSNRIKVDSEEYKVYINEYDKVYVIHDMKNGNYKVLSPNHYKYVGDKLSYTNINSLSTKTNNGYLLFMGIILIIVALFFFLLSIYPLFSL